MDYSETIEVCDIKVGIYSKLNKWVPGQTEVSLPIEPSWNKGTQIYQSRWVHMTQMAAMPINW